MQKDFYLNERSLAGYVEKDWFDHILKTEQNSKTKFSFAEFDPTLLYSPYHEKFVAQVCSHFMQRSFKPRTMFEVGSSLGRTFYEFAVKAPSLLEAHLVEPSQGMCAHFGRIFQGSSEFERFDILNGNSDVQSVWLDTKPMKSILTRIEVKLSQAPFQNLANGNLGQYDLVICSNVIDQCSDPVDLFELLKRSTAPGGVLAVSCTYQWQDKYIGSGSRQIPNIKELIAKDWELLEDSNIPFQFRTNERHWMTFLSHVCAWQRPTEGKPT